MAEELKLQIPGLSLAAQAYGPTTGRPLLALHGWLDNAASFARLAPVLEGYRVVALDAAGHGRSEHRAAHAGYHFVDWVPDVVSAADQLGWDRFVLMGHSMGAAISTLVAGTFPERVERLVLIDGLAPIATEAEDVPKTLRQYIEQVRRAGLKSARPYADLDTMVSQLSRLVPDLTPDTARLLVARGNRQVAGGVTWSYDQRLRRSSSMRFSPAHVDAFLRAVECPTLFIRPRNGIPIPSHMIERAYTLIGHMQKFECEGRHHVHMDRPIEVAQAILDFLSRE